MIKLHQYFFPNGVSLEDKEKCRIYNVPNPAAHITTP